MCRLFALIVSLIFIAGCDSNIQKQQVPYVKRVVKYLPKDAKQVKEIGNGWVTFEITIDGKTHKFIARPSLVSNVSIVTSITEISQ